ncbi:L-rhamnose mutarotase [Rhodococcus jostii]|uniref:L-rhamnose mutarotase n=1 Tax=Rhodococcus jostii TaxID=132919 RepID=A0A1H5C9I8_RHOJO|nr:L-rhamnose mutarotase [Rhodococcus jostii]SED63296.1 L-rhamnose mutarotase [Rhodococcus jostii]
MNKYCFTLQLRPDRIDEYVRRHAHVWPEMLEALKASGWHNYSLHIRPDGLIVGYVESENLEQAQAAMARTDVNRRWQHDMAPFFELDGVAPDEGFTLLTGIFDLDAQLHTPLDHTISTEG